MKHTPGPWTITDRLYDISQDDDIVMEVRVIKHGMSEIAYVPSADTDNTRLIAAAPDLLRLAEHIALDPYALTPDQWASEARAAIAKAEGRS